jgi:hypothetical protein
VLRRAEGTGVDCKLALLDNAVGDFLDHLFGRSMPSVSSNTFM